MESIITIHFDSETNLSAHAGDAFVVIAKGYNAAHRDIFSECMDHNAAHRDIFSECMDHNAAHRDIFSEFMDHNAVHRDIFSQYCYIKPKSDCVYHFLFYLERK